MIKQPTEAHLLQAFRLCKVRAWPATFDEAMRDPLRARLITACAIGLANKPAPIARPEFFELEQPPGRVDARHCV